MADEKEKARLKYYYEGRSDKLLTIRFDDPEMKKRIKELAKEDSRSVCAWFDFHVNPIIEELVEKMEADMEKRKGRKK